MSAPQAAENPNTEERRAQEEKVQKIREAQKLYNESVDEQIEIVEMAFADLKQIIKDEILNIKEKQKAKNKEAEDYIKALQKTSVTPPTNNRPFTFPPNKGTALSTLNRLKRAIENEKKFLAATQLKAAKKFTVNVTFNNKNQEMYDALSNGHDNFTTEQSFLGRPIFSSGKIYFEVDVKGKEFWGVGVAEESDDRKGEIKVNPKNGFWMISRRPVKGEFVKVYIDKPDKSDYLYVDQPEFNKVGVFVDFGKRLVKFFNVDTPDIIHTFRGKSFLKLRPLMV